jgi:anthranilate synthase component 1
MGAESSYIPAEADFVAAAGRGNLLPVYREIMADSETPVSAFAKLRRSEWSFLLESVVGGEKWGAYSFIGVQPRAVLRCRGQHASVTWTDVDGDGGSREASWTTADATSALVEVMREWRPVVPPGLPRFFGGAVGWVSYDAVRAFENLPAKPRVEGGDAASGDLGLPELCMVLTDTLVIFDNFRQTIKIVATPYVPRPERAAAAYAGAIARIDAVIARLREPGASLRPLEPPPADEDRSTALRWGGGAAPPSGFAREDFLAAVARAREYILAGDVFQVVLSQRFAVPRDGVDPFDVYRALRVVNPSPYMFHLDFPDARVTGASPEVLVRSVDGRVEVRPIAGTRPRGRTPDEDAALAAALRADPKELAEHLMLIDLGRNDVGRVARTGSVVVDACMEIERYSHVMHMTSQIHGELDAGLGWHDVLRAAFPAGTLTGAPKIRAMEIIDELEPHRRGIYGGAVGYVSYAGNMDLAIAIRTLVTMGDTIYLQAGAGLVYDSVAESEYEETLNKARGVLRAVAMARGADGPGAR